MLVQRLIRVYPEFGSALMKEVVGKNLLDQLANIQDEHLEEMEECEEIGSSDMAAFTWNFARDCIYAFSLPYECVVLNHKYEIIEKIAA